MQVLTTVPCTMRFGGVRSNLDKNPRASKYCHAHGSFTSGHEDTKARSRAY